MGSGRRRKGQPPPLLHHKGSNQAYATAGGEPFYFGLWGTPAALEAYEDFLAFWRVEHGSPVTPKAVGVRTIAAAVAEYLADISPPVLSPGEYGNVKRDLDRLADRFGRLSPDDLRPLHFKAVRQDGIDKGLTRTTINQRSGRILRFLKWCVAHDDELCTPDTLAVLKAIPPLPLGKAAEPVPIVPAPWGDLVRTLRVLPRRLRAMAIVQMHAGPRPGEICRIRGREIFPAGSVITIEGRSLRVPAGVWLFRPELHKTKRKGKEVVYVLGPKCQAALKPFLRTNPDDYLFSPAEADLERKAAMRKARLAKRNKIQPSQVDRAKKRWARRKPGPRYTTQSYGRAIHRVCEEHGIVKVIDGKKVATWNPNQLRHLFVTRMDLVAGLVVSSAAVGHAQLATTAIYTENRIKTVAEVAARVG